MTNIIVMQQLFKVYIFTQCVIVLKTVNQLFYFKKTVKLKKTLVILKSKYISN